MEESLLRTPGHVLRSAREAKGLSQTEVANRLRLALQVVKALEADDYAEFAASVYARGYLRAYATLLELESEALLTAFEQLTAESHLDQPLNSAYVPSSITKISYLHQSKRRFARGLSWMIGIFLIILLGIWWYGQHHRKHIDMSMGLLTPVPAKVKPPIVTPAPVSTPAATASSVLAPVSAPVSTSAPAAPSAPLLTPVPKSSPGVVAPAPKSKDFRETFILEPKKQQQ